MSDFTTRMPTMYTWHNNIQLRRSPNSNVRIAAYVNNARLVRLAFEKCVSGTKKEDDIAGYSSINRGIYTTNPNRCRPFVNNNARNDYVMVTDTIDETSARIPFTNFGYRRLADRRRRVFLDGRKTVLEHLLLN